MRLVLVTLVPENDAIEPKKILVNQDTVCSIEQIGNATQIKLSSGETRLCVSPSFEEWLNDYRKQINFY